MSVPNGYDDGNFALALQNGCQEYTLPFFDKGDDKSFEISVTRRVAAASFTRPELMSKIIHPKMGIAFLVEMTSPRAVGNGLIEWQETYASIPQTRYEASSIIYPMQFLSLSTSYDWDTVPAAPQVQELPVPMSCTVKYEYFIKKPEIQIAPRVAVLYNTVVAFGGWGTLIPGKEYLAQDAEISIYKGEIFQRRGVYITWPAFVKVK